MNTFRNNGMDVPGSRAVGRTSRVTTARRPVPMVRAVAGQFRSLSDSRRARRVVRSSREVLGMLGRTGSGKTTISRLLFRLYDPGAGVIRLGGTDIREAKLDALRARIGLVTQDVQLFGATLRDNVSMFDPSVPDDSLWEVFGELGIAGWLRSFPQGLDTCWLPAAVAAGEAHRRFARVFLRDPWWGVVAWTSVVDARSGYERLLGVVDAPARGVPRRHRAPARDGAVDASLPRDGVADRRASTSSRSRPFLAALRTDHRTLS